MRELIEQMPEWLLIIIMLVDWGLVIFLIDRHEKTNIKNSS